MGGPENQKMAEDVRKYENQKKTEIRENWKFAKSGKVGNRARGGAIPGPPQDPPLFSNCSVPDGGDLAFDLNTIAYARFWESAISGSSCRDFADVANTCLRQGILGVSSDFWDIF